MRKACDAAIEQSGENRHAILTENLKTLIGTSIDPRVEALIYCAFTQSHSIDTPIWKLNFRAMTS